MLLRIVLDCAEIVLTEPDGWQVVRIMKEKMIPVDIVGQAMVMLRTAMNITQMKLAQLLGVSRGAVVNWEAGSSYPKAERLKPFIALCVQQQAFAAGHEEAEIHALWQAAHQKVRLDEPWLSSLLGEPPQPLTEGAPRPAPGRQLDWEDALDVSTGESSQQEEGKDG